MSGDSRGELGPSTVQLPRWVAAVASLDGRAIALAADRGARMLLATAVFLVPVVFEPRTLDGFNLTKLTALWTFGVMAAGACWLSRHLAAVRRSFTWSLIPRLSLAVLAVVAVATVLSPNRSLSVTGLYQRYEGLSSLVLYVAVFLLLVLIYLGRPAALRELAAAMGLASGAIAIYVFIQRLGIDPIPWRETSGIVSPYPMGNLGNSAFTSSYLGMSVPIVLYLALSAPTRNRKLFWLAIGGATLLALWFAQGRAGMLAAVTGASALFLFARRVRPAAKVALVALTLVVLGTLAVLIASRDEGSQSASVTRTQTLEYRVEWWSAAIRMVADRPLFGWGPESFYGQFPRYRTQSEARDLGLQIADKPHNIFLGWATSSGLAGLAAYLLLYGAGVTLAARSALGRSPWRPTPMAAYGAALVAYLAQGLFSIDTPPLALVSWVALGAVAVLTQGANGATETAVVTRGRLAGVHGRGRRWAVRGAVLLAVVLALIVGLRPLRADHAAWVGVRSDQSRWSNATMALFEKAIGLGPPHAAYRGIAATYLERSSEDPSVPGSEESALLRSASLFREARRLQPYNLYFMIDLARVYERLGAFDSEYFARGDRLLERAISLDPRDPELHARYVYYLQHWATMTDGEARDDLERRVGAMTRKAFGFYQGLR